MQKKPFIGYPTRTLRVSKEVWDELKTQKIKSGKTWTNFLSELIKKKSIS